MIKILLLIITFISLTASVLGQELNRSLSKIDKNVFLLHFRVNSALVERDFRDNDATLTRLNTLLTESPYIVKTDTITMYATSSPDGVLAYNEQLALKRCVAIKAYLIQRYSVLESIVFATVPQVSQWSELIRNIERDSTITHKKMVLELLENPDNLSNTAIGRRLKGIDNGVVWQNIATHHLSIFRSGKFVVNLSSDRNTVASMVNNTINLETPPIPRVKVVENKLDHKVIKKELSDTINTQAAVNTSPILELQSENKSQQHQYLALKTNLLFDLLSLVNLELEVPIGNRFSVAGEVIFPWWTLDNGNADSKRHRIQLLNINLEGRYWFGNRTKKQTMTGWFAGAYIGSSVGGVGYDFEYNAKGYQGDSFVTGGISGGYTHTINKKGNLRMEYALGLGYMQTNYKHYKAHFSPMDEWHPMYDKEVDYSYLGPTRVKISFVWMLNKR